MNSGMQLSPEVRDLLDHILVPKEEERITIPEIEAHPWYEILHSCFHQQPLPYPLHKALAHQLCG